MQKQEKVVLALTIISVVCVVLYLAGSMLTFIYFAMGEENYEICLDVLLYPVENYRGDLIDVDVRFKATFSRVRVPHEVVGWRRKPTVTSGRTLFSEDEGSLSLLLSVNVQNFTTIVYSFGEEITVPKNHSFIIYCASQDAEDNTILQLNVDADKQLVLNMVKEPITEEWSFVEKWEI